MKARHALLAFIALTAIVHLATRSAMGIAQCHPQHCTGGPRW